MRVIPTQVHGILDYLVGVVLIIAPWILRFNDGGAAQWVPVILGVTVIVYSLLTRYELGVVGLIPMPIHLWLDVLGGLVLLLSPWLFGFSDVVWVPHVVFGLIEIVVALISKTEPSIHHTGVAA